MIVIAKKKKFVLVKFSLYLISSKTKRNILKFFRQKKKRNYFIVIKTLKLKHKSTK